MTRTPDWKAVREALEDNAYHLVKSGEEPAPCDGEIDNALRDLRRFFARHNKLPEGYDDCYKENTK